MRCQRLAGSPFVVSTTGAVTIELTSVEPPATLALGVGIASWDGKACGKIADLEERRRAL